MQPCYAEKITVTHYLLLLPNACLTTHIKSLPQFTIQELDWHIIDGAAHSVSVCCGRFAGIHRRQVASEAAATAIFK